MLDKMHILLPAIHNHHTTRVEVKQATTPEQLKHLDEIRADIVKHLRVAKANSADNILSITALDFHKAHLNGQYVFYFLFKLNAQQYEIGLKVEEVERLRTNTPTQFLEYLVGKVSEEIAVQLIGRLTDRKEYFHRVLLDIK